MQTMPFTLTWRRLADNIWMSSNRDWLITENQRTGEYVLDDLQADEFRVFTSPSLEAVQAEAQRQSMEVYLAILNRDGSLDFGEPLEAGMPTHRQTI
jgi:hypothetical protein